jgi:hypothetical protein
LADFVRGERTWEKGTPRAGKEELIEFDDFDTKTLQVAVKQGTLAEGHYAEIRQAQAYADDLLSSGRTDKPIKIVVVEIP